MLPSSSPIILYHHILTLSRPQKNSENALRTSWHPGYGVKYFDCVALLIWPTQVSNIFSVVRWAANIQKMDYRRGRQLGLMLKNWQEHSRVSDNACQAIPENWSARLDKLGLIQKRKRLENTYERCVRLLVNFFNDTYVVYLLQAHNCRPSGGLKGVHRSPRINKHSLGVYGANLSRFLTVNNVVKFRNFQKMLPDTKRSCPWAPIN